MSEDFHNFEFEKIIWENVLYLQGNINAITVATFDIGEKTLGVLDTERHIFANNAKNSTLKYLHIDYVKEGILNQNQNPFYQATFTWLRLDFNQSCSHNPIYSHKG